MSLLSTTRLAGLLEIGRNELIAKLIADEYLKIEHGVWKLTEKGKKIGGKNFDSTEGYSYIVWPEKIKNQLGFKKIPESEQPDLINTTKIANQFGVTPQRLNLILSEIGWIKKHLKGWSITNSGRQVGGIENEFADSGAHYVVWPKTILKNKILSIVIDSMIEDFAHEEESLKESHTSNRIKTFRKLNPGKYRTKDGHWVRSRAEIIIDDALYDYGLAHSYERRLPIEEEVYSDFYLPGQSVYIEFWGLEDDPKYLERKKKKINLYKKYNLSLIELKDEHLVALDDYLPVFLLKFGIRVY